MSIVQSIQSLHTPWLDTFFRWITRLGNAEGYLLLLPFLYWCVDDRLGRRAGIAVIAGLVSSVILKMIVGIPRPDPTLLRVLDHPEGASFPSGHAKGTAILGGYLMRRWRHPWLWGIILTLLLLVGFSRLYLAVHYPQDVLGGWLIALALLWLFWRYEDTLSAWLLRQPLALQLALCLPLPLAVLFSSTRPERTPVAGVLLGFACGMILERRFLRFSAEGTLPKRALRYLAFLPLALLMYGLKLIFPSTDLFRFLRYLLVGGFGAFGAPWLFLKLRLAASLQPSTPQH